VADLVPQRSGNRAVERWRADPWGRLQDEFDTLFNDFFGNWVAPRQRSGRAGWGLDLDENDHEVTVRAEVPGFEPNDLDVQLSDNRLVIQAEHRQEEKSEGMREQSYRTFRRALSLPPGLNIDKAEASCRNGVLEIHVPWSESRCGRKLSVKGESASTGEVKPNAGQGAPAPNVQAQGAQPAEAGKK